MKAIIVDDELHGRENLRILIEKNCKEIEIVGLASNAFEANKLIELHHPDVVFLDVVMGLIDGITYLKSIKEKKAQVVIVSAHREYALEAMENGAFGYLLKPVMTKTLQEQVEALKVFFASSKNVKEEPKPKIEEVGNLSANRIAITHSNGYVIVGLNEIIRFEAQGNYTKIHLANGTELLSSKTLKKFNDQIRTDEFFRIHKTHFVNVSFIKEVKNEGNGYVVLKDGTELPIAVLKRPLFNKFMKQKRT
jgi:two-component system LytT family response regulator